MYCKYCGVQNTSDQTYCQNCGKLIKVNTIPLGNIAIEETKTAYCKKCGTAVVDRYCTECGTSGISLNIKKGAKPKIEIGISKDQVNQIKSKIQSSAIGDIKGFDDVKELVKSKPIFKISSISAIKILGAGLIISFLVMAAIMKIEIVEVIFNGLNSLANLGLGALGNLKPNFIDLYSLSLQSPINMSLKIQGEIFGENAVVGAKLVFASKMLILALIPIIGVLIAQFKSFKDEESSSEKLMEYGLTSLIFSIIFKIIMIFNQKGFKLNDVVKVNFKIGFHDIWSILSIFLIIFAIQVIISMIMKKDNPFAILNIDKYPRLGERIKEFVVSMSIFTGIISIAILLIIIVVGSKTGGIAKLLTMAGIVLLPSIFAHTWLFSFGTNLTSVLMETEPIKANIFKTFKGIGRLKANYSDGGWAFWGYIFIIAVLLGLIYVIYRVVKDIKEEQYFQELGFIAASLSLINIGISYLVSIGMSVTDITSEKTGYGLGNTLYDLGLGSLDFLTGDGATKQSYPFLNIIVMTFIWVFAIGALIYFLRKNDLYNKITSFIEENTKKLVLGYTGLILISFYLLQSKILTDMVDIIIHIFPMLDMF